MSRTVRRTFLKQTAGAALALAVGGASEAAAHADTDAPAADDAPWYRRTLRWGQTNITEIDPAGYDIAWWRGHWKRTRVQGVILNAGGIVAYYPSQYPLHYRPPLLGDRDLYGELARAAHDDGLAVFARMDSNRTHEAFYQAHPDWFARDAAGNPYRAGELFVTCVNSLYYEEYIPAILTEIIERTHPEGITDNSWSGLGRDSICYCENCAQRFQERTGKTIPGEKNWDDPVYREWIEWNYARRLEIWERNNRATRAAGGPHCLWVGMNSGSISGQSRSFRDLKEICRRAEILMLDHQARADSGGFQQNGETGKLVHGLLGWDKLAPESMAMYQAGRPTFRKASKPEPEARLWMLEGFAGTIQPWWHHIGAYHEDRRQYRTVEPINRWHEANQQYLVGREPVASVGLVWSQQNTDYYGRDSADELVELPFRGMANALLRARIPYLPVHADHIERDGPRLSVLVLPNLAAMSQRQCAAVREFVERGGNLIATGQTSLYDPSGQPRSDFA
ncbi:MAG: beta-galactosidase, partial [Thermoguttaceae bacterium]|nr:beta-galactosidase [Thermoguttaceae bacterium]